MNTTELQLFEFESENENPNAKQQQPIKTLPKTLNKNQDILYDTLSEIFPENTQEQKIVQARIQLQLSKEVFPDERLEHLLTDFDFLANHLLDTFERQLFDGKTLSEILHR